MSLELPLRLDRSAGLITAQLAAELRRAIGDGRLQAGARLPSTRELAADLAVSRTVVVEAYERLVAEGYLRSVVGSGTFVEALDFDGQGPTREVSRSRVSRSQGDHPAVVNMDDFQGEWARAWRQVARLRPPSSYRDARGERELRRALASYLRRSRGLLCEADEIVVTSGTVQSMDLLLRSETEGDAAVALEEPCDPAIAAVVRVNRRIVAARVDADGLRVRDLDRLTTVPKLVYVTPSHQYPLGHRMSVARRVELINWVRRHDAIILEDDYDSEFRYDGPPLPTLYSLAPRRVVYLGTISKVLTPAFRCGYIVAKTEVAERVADFKFDVDGSASWPIQSALIHLLTSGDLEKHIRRMRQRYSRVRAALDKGLADLEGVEVTGLSAGLNAVVRPRAGIQTNDLISDLGAIGMRVQSLTNHFHSNPVEPYGLLVRYGALTESEAYSLGRSICRVISLRNSNAPRDAHLRSTASRYSGPQAQ